MRRRTYLRSLALGATVTAGCLETGSGQEGDASVSDVELRYPQFSAATYHVSASPVQEFEGEPVPFGECSRQSRIEIANGVARAEYRTGESPAVLEADRHHEVVDYRGTPVSLTVSVADRFQEPEHGPDADPDWEDPIAVDASVAEGELTVELRNGHGEPIPVFHYGRPYLGVLTAVGGTATPLEHQRYEDNEFVRTGDPLRTERVRHSDRQRETLAPGDSLTESYVLPSSLPETATVWFAIPIGDETTDPLGNGRTSLAATITLSA